MVGERGGGSSPATSELRNLPSSLWSGERQATLPKAWISVRHCLPQLSSGCLAQECYPRLAQQAKEQGP